jgi:hypothetical protein
LISELCPACIDPAREARATKFVMAVTRLKTPSRSGTSREDAALTGTIDPDKSILQLICSNRLLRDRAQAA